MYKKSITELPVATNLNGTEIIAIVQDGRTKKATISQSISSVSQVFTSDTPPATPFEGQLWFRTTNSRLYSYNVGDASAQWVQV